MIQSGHDAVMAGHAAGRGPRPAPYLAEQESGDVAFFAANATLLCGRREGRDCGVVGDEWGAESVIGEGAGRSGS
jgi:hypothetical protein